MTVEKKEAPKQGFPIVLSIALTVVMLFAMSMVVRGCGGEGGVPLISTGAHYGEVLDEVEKGSTKILEKADREEQLTESELKTLERLSPKTIGLINFDTARFAPYIIAAKFAFAKEEYQACIDACTRVFERAPVRGDDATLAAIAETRYVCSRAYFKLSQAQQAASEAKEATRINPSVAKYWWALASAQLELGQESEAIRSIYRGQAADPDDTRISALASFILFDRKLVDPKDQKKDVKKEVPKKDAPKTPDMP